jgi:hypothetical protein
MVAARIFGATSCLAIEVKGYYYTTTQLRISQKTKDSFFSDQTKMAVVYSG